MKMDEQQKEKMKNAAEEAAQKAKAAGLAAAEKADELYNKLPLDKVNEKLGGKVDVKSKKFKIIAASVLVGLIVLVLALVVFGGGGAPSSDEISKCKTRINRFEKEIYSGRRCTAIKDFEKMSPVKPTPLGAKLFKLKAGEECKRYKCTIVWKDGGTSSGVFLRQGDKFGVLVSDWF